MPHGTDKRYAKRRRDFKSLMKDKQLRRSLDKDKVVPEEKRQLTDKEKMLLERYGQKPDWMKND